MTLNEIKTIISSGNLIRFYKSKEWLAKAKQVMKRDNYECQSCKSKGKFHVAECVHHIKELKTAPHLALSSDNLTSLCKVCHNEIHDRFKYKKKKPRYTNEERW